jgi:energy-coupling factor transporter ATP-binding protein EcfA2
VSGDRGELYYAGDGAAAAADDRDRQRVSLITRWLPQIVDDVLAQPEIERGLQRSGLDPAAVRQQVLDGPGEIVAVTTDHLERVVDAALVARRVDPSTYARSRWLAVGFVLFGLAATLLGPSLVIQFWDRLAWWSVTLGIVLSVSGLVWGFMALSVARDTYHGTPPASVRTARAALARWRVACRDDGVLPFVRRILNAHVSPEARMSLQITTEDAPGLHGDSESSYVVRTGSVSAFLAAAERLPTGAIGLAGPRGVGKTSLIEHFAGRVDEARPVKVTVSAPVQYEPRDFVLHLFALVCQAVLRERWVRRSRFRRRSGIVALASTHLANIHYLQTHTTGWSGKVTLPRSEVGWSRTRQQERRPQTYPELVAALCEFLAAFAEVETAVPAMIIAVDELDKIESADRAQQFVNEIKSIFAAPGTQFLVSVSEDALASFERRGLPVRDAFDSAFHEIVRVDYLTVDDTAQLLASRVIALPEPFVWLVHCLSGGLPRDVVRTARAMVALTTVDAPPSLDVVCAALVGDDLNRKSHAFQLACRDIGDSAEVTGFIRSLRQLAPDTGRLSALVPTLLHGGELASLSRQAAAYVYYSATLLAVFTRDRVDQPGAATFDGLARAKQSLAVHPRLAWLLVDEFREAAGMATIPAD